MKSSSKSFNPGNAWSKSPNIGKNKKKENRPKGKNIKNNVPKQSKNTKGKNKNVVKSVSNNNNNKNDIKEPIKNNYKIAIRPKLQINNDDNDETELDLLFEGYTYDENMDVSIILELLKKNKYAYNPLIQFCPRAFELYLKYGDLKDNDFAVDIPYIIESVINGELGFDWYLFVEKIRECKHKFPNTELYINKVVHFNKMIDAYNLGFIDHRLERAIINIQRFLRKEETDKSTNIKYAIRLNSIKQFKYATSDSADTSILLNWNKHLIIDVIIDYLQNDEHYYYQNIIDDINLEEIKNDINKKLYKLIPHPITEDFYAKFMLVSDYYIQNQYKAWRCYDTEVLKYLHIDRETNEAKLKEFMLKKIIKYNYDDLQKILKYTKLSLASYGRNILKEFIKLDIDKLTVDSLKVCFLKVILDPLDTLEFDSTLLHKFLRNKVNGEIIKKYNEIIQFIKKTLKTRQLLIKKRKYVYKVDWEFYKPQISYVIILDL